MAAGEITGLRGGRLLLLLALLGLLVAAPAAGAQDPRNEAPTFKALPHGSSSVPEQVIVKYEDNAGIGDQAAVRGEEGLRKKEELGIIDAEVVEVEGRSAGAAARDLSARPDVEYAVPDRLLDRFGYSDEPRFGELWGLNNTGQEVSGDLPGGPGKPDVDVNALEASSMTKGDPSITVAVIDDGVDFSHADLQGRQWANPGESGGGKETNGLDDDGNGLVDDVNGYDFANGDNTVHDPFDDAHGTHVAGTVAAAEDGEGVVGVAPNVEVMALKFIGGPMGGTTSGAISAIEYARAEGADMINASWGCVGCPPEDLIPLEQAIEASKLLFVAAAGNNGGNNDDPNPDRRAYPASFDSPNIISVAAIENTGDPAFFTNTGARSVDIAAPGVNVLSSVPGTPTLPAATLSTVDNDPAVDATARGPGKALVPGFGVEEFQKLADQEAFMAGALEAVGRTDEPVVLVDDDLSEASGSPDTLLNLRNAIETSTGQRPEVTDVPQGDGPALEQLQGKVVVWSTGWAYGSDVPDQMSEEPPAPALTPADRQTLEAFLSGGGKLVLSGLGTTDRIEETTFVKQVLGLSVRPDQFSLEFGGSAGTAFDGTIYPFGGVYAIPFAHDAISPAGGSSVAVRQGVYPGSPDGWESWSGTSMAAPHVTGTAALVASAKPELRGRPVALKDTLMKSAKPVPATRGLIVTGGMVDALAALKYTPPADTVAPTVTRVLPAAGARRVAPNTNIVATFSEAMNGKTLNKATVTLVKKGTARKVAATVRYNAAKKSVVLDPERSLQRGVTYGATVTTGAKDAAGNPLAKKKTWSFTVRR